MKKKLEKQKHRRTKFNLFLRKYRIKNGKALLNDWLRSDSGSS